MASMVHVMDPLSQTKFFTYAIPWLLTFAVVFGILEHYQMPRSNSARTIISLVIAFFVMPVAEPMMTIIAKMGMGMLILFAGLLFILILFEIAGVRTKFVGESTKEGKVKIKSVERPIQTFYKHFGIAVAILAVMVFIGSGGLEYLGYTSIPRINYTLVFFIGAILLIIWWMIKEGSK